MHIIQDNPHLDAQIARFHQEALLREGLPFQAEQASLLGMPLTEYQERLRQFVFLTRNERDEIMQRYIVTKQVADILGKCQQSQSQQEEKPQRNQNMEELRTILYHEALSPENLKLAKKYALMLGVDEEEYRHLIKDFPFSTKSQQEEFIDAIMRGYTRDEL